MKFSLYFISVFTFKAFLRPHPMHVLPRTSKDDGMLATNSDSVVAFKMVISLSIRAEVLNETMPIYDPY